ncbi:matrix metallo ase-11 [Fusarium beomiforme]|uniref:Matrix metallo ase-11 n=1 Tax=Fusarium beomiforme TaxID=44412 RepID=A0A9P5E1A4_9HYPO|nr:matrix metallo ase-11 [Fusarium beomiforme]
MPPQGPSTKEILLGAVAQTAEEKVLEVLPMDVYPENSPSDILMGFKDQVSRWNHGSVVRWSVFKKGFEAEDDARHVAFHMAVAAEMWNKAEVDVTFEWLELVKDAMFALFAWGFLSSVLARAFEPSSPMSKI